MIFDPCWRNRWIKCKGAGTVKANIQMSSTNVAETLLLFGSFGSVLKKFCIRQKLLNHTFSKMDTEMQSDDNCYPMQ